MSTFSLRQKACLSGAAAITLVLFQVILLFWNRPFYVDWVNHVWTVEYFSVYLKQHGSFPTTIDVAQGFGSVLPLFYGMFFYPFFAVLSVFTGADLAVRLLCGALLLAPMISFTVLFHSFTKEYSRSALTEFVALQLLLLSLSLVFYGLTQKSRIGSVALSLGFACAAL